MGLFSDSIEEEEQTDTVDRVPQATDSREGDAVTSNEQREPSAIPEIEADTQYLEERNVTNEPVKAQERSDEREAEEVFSEKSVGFWQGLVEGTHRIAIGGAADSFNELWKVAYLPEGFDWVKERLEESFPPVDRPEPLPGEFRYSPSGPMARIIDGKPPAPEIKQPDGTIGKIGTSRCTVYAAVPWYSKGSKAYYGWTGVPQEFS